MASKVEILGGQLDGSTLDNAASESTLKELVEAIKKLEATTAKSGKGGQGAGNSPSVDTSGANSALDDMAKKTDKSSNRVNSSFESLGKAMGINITRLGQFGDTFNVLKKNVLAGNNNLSDFTNALAYLPGPLGAFANALTGSIAALEEMQKTQRMLANNGASFNNSLLDMRIAAAESGLSLAEYADFVKSNAQGIAGLGDTITEGAQKLSALGKAVGDSGLDVEFMKLGMSAQQARIAAMRFSSELVKGDRVRSASVNELASASLSYEKDLDLLAKQTGRSKDELRNFADGLIKKSGAMLFSFAGMAPGVQASMKAIMNTVGNTMGDGAATAMADLVSGAAAPSSEASAMFQSQVPGAVKAFKDMKDVANDTSLSDEQRRAKLDMLQAKAQAEQLKFLQTEQGRFMMQNKSKLSPAQREFVDGLEKNAASLSAQGIDINKASAADIEASIAAKRAEQERQAALDAGLNRFQGLLTNIGSMLQTKFFTLIKDGLNMAFEAFDKLGTTLKPLITGVKMVGDEFEMIGNRIGGAFDEVVSSLQPMRDMITGMFVALNEAFGPMISTVTDWLVPAFQGISDFIQENLTPIVGAVVTVLGTMAVMALPAIISGLVAFGASLVTAAATILAPFLPVILAVAAVAYGFAKLKQAGWDVQTALEAIKDNLYKYMFLPFKEIFVNLLSFLPQKLGGYSKEEEEVAKKGLDDEKAALAARATARDATRANNVKENAIAAEKVKEENKKFREEKAAGRAQQDAAQAKKDAIREVESADAMERSKARALKGMRELAGIEKPSTGPAVAPSPGTGGTVPGAAGASSAPLNQDQQKNLELIKASLVKQGITDPKMIAATLGNVMKESGGKTQDENLNYKNTSNDRIRGIFKSATAGKSDAEINEMKSSPEKMAEANYGSGTKLGAGMGNTEVGDGWKFRGRGFIQITGKNNYSAASKAIFGDDRLVKNPDMANDPAVAAEISAWFMKRGTTAMAAKMGLDPTKDQASANLVATSVIAGGDVRKKGDYLAKEVVGKVDKSAGSAQIQAIANGTGSSSASATPTTQTASAKPTPVGGTAPTGQRTSLWSRLTSSTADTPPDQAAKDKAEKDKAQAEKDKANQAPSTPATNPITDVITSLNTSLTQLTMLQARAVSIAEQQLRATNGLSRDAYKAV